MRKRQAILNLFEVPGEGLNQVGGIVELDQKKFVFGIRSLEELGDREAGLLQFASHRAAAVEDHADRKRRILARELADLLLLLILKNFEVLFIETSHETVQRIGHGNRDQHERAVHTNVGLRGRFGLLGGLLARRHGTLWRCPY